MVRIRSNERGANAVEFALLVPLLILLLFGIISFGWMFSQQLALNNAVREGARFAVTEGNPTAQQCQQIPTTVRASLAGSTIGDPAAVTVTSQRIGGAGALNCSVAAPTTVVCQNSRASNGSIASLQVDATYPSRFILPVPLGPTITLNARAVYRCEFV
jgi:Flp pilus assembly protein TadG